TQLMDRLEAEGLVRRVDDPTDRRGVRAVVTPLGVERQAAGALRVQRAQEEFVKRLLPAAMAAPARGRAPITECFSRLLYRSEWRKFPTRPDGASASAIIPTRAGACSSVG